MKFSTTAAKTNRYGVYVKLAIGIAKSIVIKFDQAAKAVNLKWANKDGGATVLDNPRTWRYYQNISGAYHKTNEPMKIVSLDTGETVPYSKETLATHPVTAKAYRYGNYHFQELLNRYPAQRTLIFGVAYPVDIDEAIAAKDGTILRVPDGLIEEYETDLLLDIQKWVYNYLNRWVTKRYAISDSLYVSTYMGQIYQQLVPLIVSLRAKYSNTAQAHSYHIQQHLLSRDFTDREIRSMTRKQLLKLYINTDQYIRSSGVSKNTDDVIDLLFTERSMPAYGWSLRQRTDTIYYANPTDTSGILPDAIVQRSALNPIASQRPLGDITVADAITKTTKQAPGNQDWYEANSEEFARGLEHLRKDEQITKVIEVGPPTTTSVAAHADMLFIIPHWIDAVTRGIYSSAVILAPTGTAVPLALTQAQCVALWSYCMRKVTGEGPGTIPKYEVGGIQDRVCDLQELAALAPSAPAPLLDMLVSTGALTPAVIPDPEAFNQYVLSRYVGKMARRDICARANGIQSRTDMVVASQQFSSRYVRALPGLTGMDYADFVAKIAFNPSGYEQDDYLKMANDVLVIATGYDPAKVNDPYNIQQAMVSAFKKLSSYTISVVTDNQAGSAIELVDPQLRVDQTQGIDGFSAPFPVEAIGLAISGEKDVPEIVDLSASALTARQTSSDLVSIDWVSPDLLTTRQSDKVTSALHIGCNAWSDSDIGASFAQLPVADKNLFFSSTS